MFSNTYGKYCGYYLSQITHHDGDLETPWSQCYKKGRNRTIPDRITKEYYEKTNSRMTDGYHANAISKIGKGNAKHSDTEEKNKNKEDSGAGYIPTAAKLWIITPILCFHVAGFIVLLYLAATFLSDEG